MPKILDFPLSWDKITGLIREKDFHHFGRSSEVCKSYRRDKEKTKILYNSSRDMILITTFNYKSVIAKNDRLVGMVDKGCIKNVLSMNTFPYYVQEGISHKLLWSIKDLNDKEIREYLGKELFGLEYVYFRNPEHLRSIPDIFHIHVFIKYEKSL